MSLEYKFTEIINTYDVSPDGRMNVIAPLNFFQEVGQRQLESLGIGLEYIMSHHYAWILVKYEVEFFHYPKAEEEVIIRTEPTGVNRFEAYRKYWIESTEGELLVTGKSVWVLADTETGKLIRINEIEDLSRKLFKGKNEILKIPRLERISDFDQERIFEVRYLDIDINQHVNNTRYVSWAYEMLPLEFIEQNEIEKISIYYREQAFYGEKVVAKSKEISPMVWRINIEREDGTVLSELKIIGRKRLEDQ